MLKVEQNEQNNSKKCALSWEGGGVGSFMDCSSNKNQGKIF